AVDVPALAGGDHVQQLNQPGARRFRFAESQKQVARAREAVAFERESLDIGNVDLSHDGASPAQCPAIRPRREEAEGLGAASPGTRRTRAVIPPAAFPGVFP